MKPIVLSLSGPSITEAERALFRDGDPAGYILFGRNIVDREQLARLTADLRDLSGRSDLPILIDQEGGRVQRMRAPNWSNQPAPARLGELWEINPALAIEAARASGRAIGADLAEVGITVNCLPLLDVPQAGSHDAIGDRAFHADGRAVAALGQAVLAGLADVGVVGVVKHMPGQGRARVDSHQELPVVDASLDELDVDFAPFRTLRDAPMGMTGHVVFTAIDAEQPASTSAKVLSSVVRDAIGFDGFLFSDDLDMKALSGGPAERAHAVVEAGCDAALNCWARLDEMSAMLDVLAPMAERSRDRLTRAMASVERLEPRAAAEGGRKATRLREELFAASVR